MIIVILFSLESHRRIVAYPSPCGRISGNRGIRNCTHLNFGLIKRIKLICWWLISQVSKSRSRARLPHVVKNTSTLITTHCIEKLTAMHKWGVVDNCRGERLALHSFMNAAAATLFIFQCTYFALVNYLQLHSSFPTKYV